MERNHKYLDFMVFYIAVINFNDRQWVNEDSWVLIVRMTLVFIHFRDSSTDSPQHRLADLQTSCVQQNKQRTHGQEVKNIKALAVWGSTILIPWFDLKPLVWDHRQKSEYTEGWGMCAATEKGVFPAGIKITRLWSECTKSTTASSNYRVETE